MSSKIDTMFNQIIAESTKETQEELKLTKEALDKSENKCVELQQENQELKITLNKYKMVAEVEALLIVDNFEAMLPLFKLKSNDFDVYGMESDEVPDWFKYLYHYYEDRERLFSLMDLFGVKYPSWAKKFRMPYDYSEEELEIFLDSKYDRYICNGNIFTGNISYFWFNVKRCSADTYKMLTNTQAFTDYVPWQLILSNKRWLQDELFIKMLNSIETNRVDRCYFFEISRYLQISDKQAIDLMKLVPNDQLYDIHENFLKRNINSIKGTEEFAKKFKSKICESLYSVFCYLNYPIEYQEEFVRKISEFSKKMSLIEKMEISKEEKIKLAMG